MRLVLQRVRRASVTIADRTVAAIGPGVCILLGVTHGDTEADAVWLAEKAAGLRIFPDAEGKMNLSLGDVGGEALVVSQFTLYGSTAKGRRPSFVDAADPAVAVPLYRRFIEALEATGVPVGSGEFGADMLVEIHNDGPVTLILERGDGA